MDHMPRAGDLAEGFFISPGRCFRMVYSDEFEVTHCDQPVVWKGRWRDGKGEAWVIEACQEHQPKDAGA
jgi:hypothetical protein